MIESIRIMGLILLVTYKTDKNKRDSANDNDNGTSLERYCHA